GLLASVVLVSMAGIREKAKITKTLEFSQSLQRNLGAYAVGIWSFDDQTNPTKDSSGYNNHGTLVNGPTFDSNTPHSIAGTGTGKYALRFDGNNDYVDAGSNILFNFANAPLVVEAWIKPNAVGTGTIVSKNCGAFAPRWIFDLNSANKLRLYSGNIIPDEVFSTNAVSAGVWSHVAVIWDGSTVAFYINGILDRKTSRTGTQDASCNNPFSIGGRIWGTSYNTLNGLIDEVRIYEKALTLGEIQKHYTEGLEGHQDLALR
ncbi:MAG: LamG domain-containing protein, partial [bacterium]|nr:LamG domain-containing protein [bacterium]